MVNYGFGHVILLKKMNLINPYKLKPPRQDMLKKIRYTLICIVLTLTSLGSHALDLGTTVRLALESHPNIQSKRMENVAAEQTVSGSLWQLGPGVSYLKGKNTFGQDTATTRFSQPLFMGGRLFSTVKENMAKRDITESELAIAQQDIITRVTESYADLFRLQKNQETARVNLEEHKRLLEMIQRRNTSGLSSDNDVILASMRHQQSLAEFEQFKAQADTQRGVLEDLISQSIPPQQLLSPPPVKHIRIKTLDEARVLAINFAPQIASQRNKASAAEARVGIERSSLLPQVYLRHEKYSGDGMRNIANQTFIAVEYQFGSGVSSAYAWTAAINQQRGAEAAIQTSEKEVTSAITREWNQYHLSKNQLNIVKLQADNSVEVRESFLRQYTIGKRTWLEVLNAQREMTQTQFTLADTEANFYRAQYKLGLLTGLLQVHDLSLLEK